MKTIYILCGVAGSGKSTWAKEQIKKNNGVIISRDEIRFNILKENNLDIESHYFDFEKEVLQNWLKEIKDKASSNSEINIYADATNLNKKSRNRILNQLPKDINVVYVIFDTPLETILERNSKRESYRKVPTEVIINMFNRFDKKVNGECIIIQ